MKTDLIQKMAEHGLLLLQRKKCWEVWKIPTLQSDTQNETIEFSSYREAMNHIKCMLGIKPIGTYFSICVRFNRGLGWEQRIIPGVTAMRVSEARMKAEKQTQEYFRGHDDLKDITVSEIMIRPGNYDGCGF